jgi:hypothetical protein
MLPLYSPTVSYHETLDQLLSFVANQVRLCRRPAIQQWQLSQHALGLTHDCQYLLDTCKVWALKEIAVAEDMDLGQVSWIARLAWV